MSATPYIGSGISLISKAQIRYEGTLYTVNLADSTVTLANVRSFGTEDRCKDKVVLPRKEVYEYIVFRGQDIQDLTVLNARSDNAEQPTQQQSQQDPAIIHSATMGSPGGYVPPYQSPGVFSPFGGLPYGNYPLGFQPPSQQFPDRQLPPVRPPIPVGIAPGTPLLPRTPTPPISVPGLSRNSTPSPSTLLQSSDSTVKTQETQTKSTSQQSTQTTKKKPSSRRNSADKTNEKENKKPEETSKEKPEEKPNQERKSSNENKPRGGRRPQGRRGGYRGPRNDSKPKEFEDEYDFESANAKFKKEEIEEELHKKLGLALNLNDEVEVEGEEQNAASNNSPEPTSYYDKTSSFFDSISCEAQDRNKNRKAHPTWAEERKLNTETFGTFGIRRGRGGYRGRGRSPSRGRGGRGGYRGRGWRGGRGRGGNSRGAGNAGWVDYPLDADSSKLQQNLPSGTTTSSQNQAPVQA